ncbi:hypothetical protein [Pilimelia columellifera]|uniref:Uncharacterized protein n=1 Tax=Pilimelia columellifera subsp. columellifera TaxID=706583 RepID=A0ABN3NRD7_9ACTN
MFSHPYNNQPTNDDWRTIATDITTEIWHAARDRGRAATAALITSATAAVVFAGWLIFALVNTVAGWLGAAGQATDAGAGHATDLLDHLGQFVAGPLLHTITDPVHSYLHTHTAGLPITGGQAFTLWLVLTAITWTRGSLTNALSARIGWAITGTLTTAAVYAGTTGPGQVTAAAITAAVWALLSVTVYTTWPATWPSIRIHTTNSTVDVDE